MRAFRYRCALVAVAAAAAVRAQAADTWQHITQPLLPSDEIQMIKNGGEEKGVAWIGTPKGLSKVENGVIRLIKESKALSVWDVTKRPEGGIWISHSTGALLVNGDQTVKALGGYNVPCIQQVGAHLWAIAKDAKDRNTLMTPDGDTWTPVPSLKDRRPLDLIKDARGVFWAVLDGDGVIEIDPVNGKPPYPQYLQRMQVRSVLTDSTGRTWCGLESGGLMMRQNNQWKRQLDRENSAVLTLMDDGAGKIWAGTSGNGVWTYDGTNWNGMVQDEGSVSLLKMTSDKRIWISTQRKGGLRYWDGKEWRASLETPMPIISLVELPGGVLLAGSPVDGAYLLGNYSIKGEASDGKDKN